MLDENQSSPTSCMTYQHTPMHDQGDGTYVVDGESESVVISRLEDFYYKSTECEYEDC